jgi:hypothetical protein
MKTLQKNLILIVLFSLLFVSISCSSEEEEKVKEILISVKNSLDSYTTSIEEISSVVGQVSGKNYEHLFDLIPNGTSTPFKKIIDTDAFNNDYNIEVTGRDPWGNPSYRTKTVKFTSYDKWQLDVTDWGDTSNWAFSKVE